MENEAQFFKVLSDPTRLRLVVLLAVRGEMCVCEFVEALGEPQYKVSRHLGIMRAENLVEARREGTWIYYKLCKPTNDLQQCLFDYFQHCSVKHKMVRINLKKLKKTSGSEIKRQ
jgi:ArsR family transcriptional regulator